MIRALSLALAGMMLLASCGSNQGESFARTTAQQVKQALTPKSRRAAPLTTETLRTRLTPELRAQIGRPVLIAEFRALNVASVVIDSARNGATTTWLSPDGVGVYTRGGGMVSGTRGLGFDLMASDINGPLAIVTGQGQGTAQRVHHYLDGENSQITVKFACTYSGGNGVVTEQCTSDHDDSGQPADLKFTNSYWLDANQRIVKSKQWIGTRNGYITLEAPLF